MRIATLFVLGCLPLAAWGQEAADVTPMQPSQDISGTVVQMDKGQGAPSSPILTVDEAALYAGSAWGKRVQTELEDMSRKVAADNDRIYDELSAEEEKLTQLRATLPPEEFRKRADAFDAHAQAVRTERLSAVRELNDLAELEQRNFFAVSVPVFAEVMAERGALVILDQRTVFISADIADVTQALIERIDDKIGPGPLPQEGRDLPRIDDDAGDGVGDSLPPVPLPDVDDVLPAPDIGLPDN